MTRDEFMQRWGGWFTGPMGGHPGGARGQFRDDLAALVKAEVEAFSAVELWHQARAEKAEAELIRVHDALHESCDGDARLDEEIIALRRRLERAEAERDELRAALERLFGDVEACGWCENTGFDPEAGDGICGCAKSQAVKALEATK